MTHGANPRTGRWGPVSGHSPSAHPVDAQWPQSESQRLYSFGGLINSCWPAPSYLSWHFDIFNILVNLSKHLSLIFILDLSSKWDCEWFLVHLLEWLYLVALEDRCGCGVLVTLGGCRHLDGLEQRWRFSTYWWLFVAGSGDLVRGIAPSPAKHRKVALVNCSCHELPHLWVDSCGVQRMDVVRATPLNRRTTNCWSTQRGLACRQACESREKNRVSPLWLIYWIFPGD
jgi:hypothetical protein